jgi:hypothetical protein
MIDWRAVGFGALWIGGLALLLAAVSMADYEAHRRQTRVAAVLGGGGYPLALNAALALFCLGMLGGGRAWWEMALWAGLALAFVYQAARAAASLARGQRQKDANEVGDDEQDRRREG